MTWKWYTGNKCRSECYAKRFRILRTKVVFTLLHVLFILGLESKDTKVYLHFLLSRLFVIIIIKMENILWSGKVSRDITTIFYLTIIKENGNNKGNRNHIPQGAHFSLCKPNPQKQIFGEPPLMRKYMWLIPGY